MNTQYRTFIVRLRLDDNPDQPPVETKVSGSVQQVGLSQIRYFDTAEKFQQTLQQLVITQAKESAEKIQTL